MKRTAIFLFAIFSALIVSAQSDMVSRLKGQRYGEGTVTLHQDSRLENLLGHPLTATGSGDDAQMMKVSGFRVQVYAGNNSGAARTEANAMGDKVRDNFPELAVYTNFISPRWICRVGDFRSIEEADVVMRRLKKTGMFKEVSIVRVQINIPY